MSMRDFAVDLMTSALAPTEILTAVRMNAWSARHGWAFLEFARRHGDFAIVSVAVLVELDGQQRIEPPVPDARRCLSDAVPVASVGTAH